MARVRVAGKTYEIRDILHVEGGAEWDSATKTWTLDQEAWDALVARYSGGGNKVARIRAAAFAGCEVEVVS